VCSAGTIAQLRIALEAIIKELEGVVIVAASEIPGLALSIVEEAGFGISLTDDSAADILDPIRNELLAVMQKQAEKQRETDISMLFEPAAGEPVAAACAASSCSCTSCATSSCSSARVPAARVPGGSCFRLDMKSALSANPDLTSKGLLIPFLEKEEFERLDVILSHIPPWFDKKFGDLGLSYETLEVLPDQITVRIIHEATE
jgi:Fe-only nitrogenase accessory protein AnfO